MPPLVGVQLYTLRDACANDLLATLRAVRSIGYRNVEGFGGLFGTSAAKVVALLEEIDLAIPTAHVPLQSLESDLPRAVDLWGGLGARTLVCPWVDETTRSGVDAWARLAERLDAIGGELRRQGMGFAYHNHDFELAKEDGLEIMMAASDPDHLSFELDVFWLAHTGADPADYLRRHAERIRFVHLKDGLHDPLVFTPLGEGEVDLGAAVRTALEIGVEGLFVEQDESDGDPFDALRRSQRELTQLGL